MKLTESIERSFAEQIIQKWGSNPRMIQKAALAAELASQGAPQDVFPPELTLGPEAFKRLSILLRGHLK